MEPMNCTVQLTKDGCDLCVGAQIPGLSQAAVMKHDYRVLRRNEVPRIEVTLVKSLEAPGGIGEPGTSCVMPALTNAIFAATGKRIRKLPVANQARTAA